MDRGEILNRAIWKYGVDAQTQMMIEEMSELTKAICKISRGGSIEDVREEMADVRIMLDQMEIIFGDTESIQEKKIERLRERLEKMRVASEESGTHAK